MISTEIINLMVDPDFFKHLRLFIAVVRVRANIRAVVVKGNFNACKFSLKLSPEGYFPSAPFARIRIR